MLLLYAVRTIPNSEQEHSAKAIHMIELHDNRVNASGIAVYERKAGAYMIILGAICMITPILAPNKTAEHDSGWIVVNRYS